MYKYVYTPTGYIMNIIHEYWYEYLWTCVSIYIYIYDIYLVYMNMCILLRVHTQQWLALTFSGSDLTCCRINHWRHIPKIWKSFRIFIASTVENSIENIKPTNNHLAGKIEVTNFAEKKTGWYAYNWQMSRAQSGYLDLLMCRFGQSIYSPLHF